MKIKLYVLALTAITVCSPCMGCISEYQDRAAETAEATEETTASTTEAATEPTEVTTEATEKPTEPEEEASIPPDISTAIEDTTTTAASPAPLGQWVRTTHWAADDGIYHTVYIRVTKVTSQTEDADYVQSVIDTHNALAEENVQIDPDNYSLFYGVELCIMEYEIYFPEDFPGLDGANTLPEISFIAKAKDDNGENAPDGVGLPDPDGTLIYYGWGSVRDLQTEESPTYTAGHTYTMYSMLTMVIGNKDFVLEATTYPEGMVSNTENEYSVYYATYD